MNFKKICASSETNNMEVMACLIEDNNCVNSPFGKIMNILY